MELQPLDSAIFYKSYFALLNELRMDLVRNVDLVMSDAVRNPEENKASKPVSNTSV